VAAPVRLLDLDGTLVLTRPIYARCIAGEDETRVREVARALESGTSVVVLARAAGVTKSQFTRRLEADPVPLVDGWKSVLPALRARGHSVGVVTSIPGWLATPLLAAAGIDGLLDVIVHAGVCRIAKPSPRPIQVAYSLLEQTPDAGDLYVGDSLVDAGAASAAGVGFAWASWGYGSGPDGAWRLNTPMDLLEARSEP
jgi:phosphoglycolate phosphatase-like HAD superfamily hydrolase